MAAHCASGLLCQSRRFHCLAFGHPGSGRQMNHYFNMEEWQDKMNARQGPKKKARTGW
jgi:hypothetical protein